jgi:hypothetical protein
MYNEVSETALNKGSNQVPHTMTSILEKSCLVNLTPINQPVPVSDFSPQSLSQNSSLESIFGAVPTNKLDGIDDGKGIIICSQKGIKPECCQSNDDADKADDNNELYSRVDTSMYETSALVKKYILNSVNKKQEITITLKFNNGKVIRFNMAVNQLEEGYLPSLLVNKKYFEDESGVEENSVLSFKYLIGVGKVEYTVLLNCFTSENFDQVLFVPKHIMNSKKYSESKIKREKKTIIIYRQTITIHYIEYLLGNTKKRTSFKPSYIHITLRYPIFVYACAMLGYLDFPAKSYSLRKACEKTRHYFGLPTFCHTTLLRYLRDHCVDKRIHEYQLLPEEERRTHDRLSPEGHAKKSMTGKKNSPTHYLYRNNQLYNYFKQILPDNIKSQFELRFYPTDLNSGRSLRIICPRTRGPCKI